MSGKLNHSNESTSSVESENSDINENSVFDDTEDEPLDVINDDCKSSDNFRIKFHDIENLSKKQLMDTTLVNREKFVKSKFSIENILGLNSESSDSEKSKKLEEKFEEKIVKNELFVKPIPVLATTLYKQYSQGME